VEITWLGHACFRLKGRDATVLTDPFGKHLGYSLGRPSANIVTVSHSHPGHHFADAVNGTPKIIRAPGEYEVAGVLITGIATYHDAEGGKKRGRNVAYLIEMEDVVVCHLGDLGHVPTSEQTEEMGNVDVLLIPVGGANTINATEASETISLIEPKIVIPMHYRTSGTARLDLDPLDKFLKEMGVKETTSQPKLTVTKSSLPEVTQVLLLDPRS